MDDAVIAERVLALVAGREGTVCPSEVARSLVAGDAAWRSLMPQVREVAAGLVAKGLLDVTRGGEPVDPGSPGGPIRLGRPRR